MLGKDEIVYFAVSLSCFVNNTYGNYANILKQQPFQCLSSEDLTLK